MTADETLAAQPRNGGSRPVPDPTVLTDMAIAKLKEQLEQYIDGKVEVLTVRTDGAEKLTNERFEAAEKLRIEQKKDTKDAVDAALSAAKEAVKEQTTASERSIDKSETGTRDQLKGLDVKIDDLKERVGRIESVKLGATEQRVVQTENRTGLYATIGIVITLALFGMALIAFFAART